MPFTPTYFFAIVFNLIAQFQNGLDLLGQSFQRFDDPASFRGGKISHPSEKQTHERENDQLRSKRFRGRDPDLRSGVHINATVAFARDRARDIVADSQCAKTFAPAFTQCAERVRSFAALADGEHERLWRHRRIAMAKLTREFDFGGNIRQPLDQIFADPCRHAERCRNR